MPTISVIIPTRNEEKLLSQCLEQFTSELKKRFGIEIIVSDGDSSDGTIAIAIRYADKVATHEDHAQRQTIAEGRNRGAAIASAGILMFLNADTVIPEPAGFIERIISRLQNDPKLLAIAVKVEVNPAERKLSDRICHGFFNQYVRLINGLGIAMARGECQIVRREAYLKIGGYNPSLAAGEDYEFFRRLHAVGKVIYDPQLLVYESPRRYRKYGYAKVYSQWIKNAFSVLLKKKAASEIWEEVR